MSKFAGFIIGAIEIGIGIATDNPMLILQGAMTIAAQAIVDLTAPHQPARQASEMEIALGEQPRCALFGETYTPGSLVDAFNYGGKYGTDWEVLIIRLADHKGHSLTGFFVSDVYLAYGADGAVPGYNGQLEIYFRADTTADPLPAIVTTYGPGWTAADIGQSGCDVIVAYKADAPNAKKPIWPGGRPRFGFVVKGKFCYDPRKDDTVPGGAGPHRWTDPSTWEWSENLAICRYNWVRGIYADDNVSDQTGLLVGRGLTALQAPPENIFAAANLCDEAGCTLYPYDSRATTFSDSTDGFHFSEGGTWMVNSNSNGALEWWDIRQRRNMGTSAGPGGGYFTSSSPGAAIDSSGNAYSAGWHGDGTYIAVTPPLGAPVQTKVDGSLSLFQCTRVLETSGTSYMYSAYLTNSGYMLSSTRVAHTQSARDFCLKSDGTRWGLFQQTGSSADFTIEQLGGAGTFTVTGLATRSAPTAAYIQHVASQAQFLVVSDGHWYAIDDSTGAIKASGAWSGGTPQFRHNNPNVTSFWTLGADFNEYSLTDASLLRSVAKANWLTNSDSHYQFDPINDAVWSIEASSTTVIIRYLDRGSGFRVAGPIYSNQQFIDVEGMFSSACAGNLITHEGDLQLEPAQAKSVVATITDDDLLSGTPVAWNTGFLSESNQEWVNTVTANYIAPDQRWNPHDAPVVRDTADILSDGQPREASLTLRLVRYEEQALRIAEIGRRLGRLWGRAQITLGPRHCELEAGDWIRWISARYDFDLTFQIDAHQIDKTWRVVLTLRQISTSAFDCGTFSRDQSQLAVSVTPPDVGAPAAGNWALEAVTLASSGASVPALEITGSAADDSYASSIVFEYWKSDGVTDPTAAPDLIPWTMYGDLAPDTVKVDITSITGGAANYAAVTYIVSGITGDRLVLGPVTVADFSTNPLTLEGGSTLLTLEGGTTPFYGG